MQTSSNKGFSLVETIVAIGVLTTGILGAAGVLAAGMQNLSSSPSDVVVTQKAAQAIETVFAARDSHRFTWAQIKQHWVKVMPRDYKRVLLAEAAARKSGRVAEFRELVGAANG